MKKRTKKKLEQRHGYSNYRDYGFFLQSLEIITILGDLLANDNFHIIIDTKFSDKNVPTTFTFKLTPVEDEELASIYIMNSKGKSDAALIKFCTVFNAMIYNMRQLGVTNKEVYIALKEGGTI